MLTEGRGREVGWPLGCFLVGVVLLAGVGAFVVVRALAEWLT